MKRVLGSIALLLIVAAAWATSPSIEVEALFTDAAVLQVDGQRKMLRVGQSFKGVTLVAAHSGTATVEVNGESRELGMSRRINSNFEAPRGQVVTISRDAKLQYHTSATINGRQVQVLVDTGANVVALNSNQARSLGVDYSNGMPATVQTASGQVQAWMVSLRSVKVGEIQVENVQASVVEGDFPATVLLGMTFLKHVKMEETNGVLSLSRAW